MQRLLYLLMTASATAFAQSSPITVVNAASYQATLAPDGLASIFGTGMAHTTTPATLDSAGNLPQELGGVRVEVAGKAADLIYVSPTQINFVMPKDAAAGTSALDLLYVDGSAGRKATIAVANAAPALFSADAQGSGPAAVLNATTFAGAPFLVETAQSGSDPRTRLAFYGTGFRHAQNLTARAADLQGNRYLLTVEYAGAAPGYFGLDQINVVLPAELDGAGAASFSLAEGSTSSNAVTAQIGLLPISQLRLASIALNPAVVNAGDSMAATIRLNGVARPGGFSVSLRSTSLAALPPALATVAQGGASVQATVATQAVSTVQTGSIQASAGIVTVSANFEVDPATLAQLSTISVSPSSILGGRNATGTVLLTNPAPAGGVNVQLASDNDSVRPPASVNVPFGQNSATFTIGTAAVSASLIATLTATQGRNTASAKLTLLPPLQFSTDTISVVGGNNVTGQVTLGEPAPTAGAVVNVASSDATILRVPPNVTISPGLNSATFTMTTFAVTSPRPVNVAVNYQNTTQQVAITVTPPAAPDLQSLTILPATVAGGTSTQGSITLAAPAGFGGVRVDLTSSTLLTAQVPASITIPQGSSNGVFTIQTTRVAAAQTVTITAQSGAITKTAMLTVQ